MTAPHKITFYCRQPDSNGVHPTFPVDSESKHDTAKSWASSTGYYSKGKQEPVVFEFDNSGFDHVTITSLDIRSEGGRAYQVVLERDGNNFQVDMREATLMDVIRNTGIEAGGRLNGSFCFNKAGSQTQLIRENSEVHKQAITDRETREKYNKTISAKDLKPGYKYSTPSGKSAVFIGAVYAANNGELKDSNVKATKHLLWAKYDEPKVFEYLKSGKQSDNGRDKVSDWYFDLNRSHSFKIEGEERIDVDLETMVSRIAELGLQVVEQVDKDSRHISYMEQFTSPYRLATMVLDRKTFKVDADIIQRNYAKLSKSRY